MLHAVAQLAQHLIGHIGRGMGDEEDAHALGANEAGHQLDLLQEGLVRIAEQQMRLVEEEDQLGPIQVADLGQRLVQAGQQPQHEGREQDRPVLHVGQLQHVDDAGAVGRGPQEVGNVELGRTEEGVGVLLLQPDDLADHDAHRGRRHAAVGLHLLLAQVAVQVVEQRPQVRQVDQRHLAVLGVLEGHGQDGLLGLVQLHDLGQQDRAERGDRCAQPHAGLVPHQA